MAAINSTGEVGIALSKALGFTDERIKSIILNVTADDAVLVTIQRYVTWEEMGKVNNVLATMKYELHEKEEVKENIPEE